MATCSAFEAALGCGIVFAALVGCKKKETPEPWTVSQPNLVGRACKLTVAGGGQCQLTSRTEKPTPGDVTVGFDVIVESTGDQQIGVHPLGVKVTDRQGASYKAFFDGGCQPALDYQRLVGKNEKHRGWFTVNVPEATEELTVVFPCIVVGRGDSEEVTFQAHRGTR